MEQRVGHIADEIEQTALTMEHLLVDLVDEAEDLENEINKSNCDINNDTPFGPFDSSVDTMPNDIKNAKKSKGVKPSVKAKELKPAKNWDKLLRDRLQRWTDKDKKGEDVVITRDQVLKPTHLERILGRLARNKNIDPKLLAQNGDLEKQLLVTLCQDEAHTLENGEEEDQFLTAVEKGDINTFMDLLGKKDNIWLNIECTDSNGMSALRIAIAEGYAVIVEQLLLHQVYMGDALLRAVDIGLPETVKILCEFAEKMPTKEERFAIMECHCDDDDFHPDVTPIVLAAQRNDFTIVKMLLDYGARINEVSQRKTKSTSQVDILLKTVGTLEVYKALSADAYLSQAYIDPIDRSFELSDILSKLSKTDVEFKHNYIELANNVDEIARDVISHCRNTEEIMTVLTFHDKKKSSKAETENEEVEKNIGPLPKLSRAIEFDQKQFVAHPNCQQAILAKFYGRLAYLRDRSPMFRRLLFLLVVFCFPFISLAYLYVPTIWVKNNIGCPYTKFMLQMSSDLLFVFLLTCDTFLGEGVYTTFTLSRPTKVLLLLWIIGIAWREVKAYRRRGPAIFSQSKHLRDSGLAFLFIVGVVFDISHYQLVLNAPPGNGAIKTETTDETPIAREQRAVLPSVPDYRAFENRHNITISHLSRYDNDQVDFEHTLLEISKNPSKSGTGTISVHRVPTIPVARKRARKNVNVNLNAIDAGGANAEVTDADFLEYLNRNWNHPRLIATAFFAVSTVISFLRMLPYVVVSDVIGPLQISLGTMITETVHFFLVVFVVVFSFSVGLTYIYSYYEYTKYLKCVNVTTTDEEQLSCPEGIIPNLFKGNVYLYWSIFGLESKDPLELPTQAWIPQAAGTTLYALFYILVVVVLLNALIAVMSNVYNEIEENGDREWKFATTVLWMDVLMDDDVVAPPFNLLPSKEALQHNWQRIVKRCRRCRAKKAIDQNGYKYTGPKADKRNGKHGKNGKNRKQQRAQYNRVMARLVERYIASKTAGEISVEADVGIADVRALRNDLLALKFEMYNKLTETKDGIGNTIQYGMSVQDEGNKRYDGLLEYTGIVRGRVLLHDDVLAEMNSIFQDNYANVPPSRPDSPSPGPPQMVDVGIGTDPPPPSRDQDTQMTPPPTPPPSPTFDNLYTQVTPPPSPPAMIDCFTEIDPAMIPQDVSTLVRRFERKRGNSIVPPNILHPEPWMPYGKPKSRPSSPDNEQPVRRNSTYPDVPSTGYGHLRTPRGSPVMSRSSSFSSGSLSPDSMRKISPPGKISLPGKFSTPGSKSAPHSPSGLSISGSPVSSRKSSPASSRKSSPAGSLVDVKVGPPTKPKPKKPKVFLTLKNQTKTSYDKVTKSDTAPTKPVTSPTNTVSPSQNSDTSPARSGTNPSKSGNNPSLKTSSRPGKLKARPAAPGHRPKSPRPGRK